MTGAVAPQKVTEARKGSLSAVGNRASSVNAQGSLTARQTGRADAKAGVSDPAALNGMAVAQRIKGTPGITGLSPPRVSIFGVELRLSLTDCSKIQQPGSVFRIELKQPGTGIL